MKFGLIVAAVASLLLSGMARAAEITVLASGATKEILLELIRNERQRAKLSPA